MPWHIVEGSASCLASKPFAVIKNADGSVAGCHPSKTAANKQLAALYANEGTMSTEQRAQLAAQSINDLPDSAFAYIEPGGKKDDQGKTVPRSLRHFPIHDAAHVRNAMARAPQSPFGDKAMPKIMAAAKKFGIGEENTRSEPVPTPSYLRSYPLEDIRILSRAQGAEYADGRTVEAIVVPFDREAEIHDNQGHYREVIDRS